jgi:ubiquinone/menaquinone biosynthesis C-methylase UbiE
MPASGSPCRQRAELAEAMDLPPGSRVLDVAAGNGNATLAFAVAGAVIHRLCRYAADARP